MPAAVVDKELRHEIRDEIRAVNGVPDYLNRDEKKVLRHFGLSALASETARVPQANVDRFLAHEIKLERAGVLGDYLAKDDKTVLQHFGYNVRAIEDAHVPVPVLEKALVKDIRRENRYLNNDERVILKHFGVSPLEVELKVRTPFRVRSCVCDSPCIIAARAAARRGCRLGQEPAQGGQAEPIPGRRRANRAEVRGVVVVALCCFVLCF